VFDMKAGVVQLLAAASRLGDTDGIWVLLTCDEEIGSPTARPLIAEAIAEAAAALVFEPSADGAIKTARKGVSQYTVRISGRAAHAGLEPERGINAAEQARVEAELRGLRPAVPGATLALEPGMMVAPLEAESSRGLFALARQAAAELGLLPLRGVSVGGGSDGNFTAAAGVPTLDGLGAVGGNAHAEGEWASLAAMPERAALAAGLIRLILRPDLAG
jgi:glutamate carboxypeptidase